MNDDTTRPEDDDTEGHVAAFRAGRNVEGDDDAVEGHRFSHDKVAEDDDAVEGHRFSHDKVAEDDDDVEGHKHSRL